jgi:hypothetical protein
VTTYTLTLDPVVGNGAVTVDPDQPSYDAGEVVTLTATADAGWSFTGWSGDLSGSTNPTTLTMDSDKAVTASFTQTQASSYTPQILVTGNGTVSSEPAKPSYNDIEVVTLTAVADPGWNFSGWRGDLSGRVIA